MTFLGGLWRKEGSRGLAKEDGGGRENDLNSQMRTKVSSTHSSLISIVKNTLIKDKTYHQKV